MADTIIQEQVVIKPEKDIVASNADDFRNQMLTQLEQKIEELVIDLQSVEMIDSVGLGIFIAAHNSLDKCGGRLTVCNASSDIATLFRAMRLDQHFTVKQAE